jgi:hypothetical protein
MDYFTAEIEQFFDGMRHEFHEFHELTQSGKQKPKHQTTGKAEKLKN